MKPVGNTVMLTVTVTTVLCLFLITYLIFVSGVSDNPIPALPVVYWLYLAALVCAAGLVTLGLHYFTSYKQRNTRLQLTFWVGVTQAAYGLFDGFSDGWTGQARAFLALGGSIAFFSLILLMMRRPIA